MAKNKIKFKHFRLIFAVIIAFLCFAFIEGKTASAVQDSDKINVTYHIGKVKDIDGVDLTSNSISINDVPYDKEMYQLLLATYDKEHDLFKVYENNKGKIVETSGEVDYIYDAGFAGWKLTKINETVMETEHIYPSHDYIYFNDTPFVNFGSDISSLEFEAVWGKKIYLRDEYNFVDLGNVFSDLKNAVIGWDQGTEDNKKLYAYPKDKAYTDTYDGEVVVARTHSSSKPVNSLTSAFEMLGKTGGVIEIINHYTMDYQNGNDNNVTGTSVFSLGQNIEKGVVTISGLGNGYNSLVKPDEGDLNGKYKEAARLYKDNAMISSVKEYYDNAYLYFKNTPGSGNNHMSGTGNDNSDQTYIMAIYCDIVFEGLGLSGYRETYYASGTRYTREAYFYTSINKRCVFQESVALYKRNTSDSKTISGVSYAVMSYDLGNWSHVEVDNMTINALNISVSPAKETTISGISASGLSKSAASWTRISVGLAKKSTDIAYKNPNSNMNLYLSLFGKMKKYNYYYFTEIATRYKNGNSFANKENSARYPSINNIHVSFNGVYVSQYRGIATSTSYNADSLKVNYYGINVHNSQATSSNFTSVYETYHAEVKQLNWKFSADVAGDEFYTSNNISHSSINLGGMNNSSSGVIQTLNVDTSNVYVTGYVKMTNLYGGGNQIAMHTTYKNLNFHISGGSISNLYGGGLGGFLDVENDITINVTGGTIKNIYGGGSGGVVVMNENNSPTKLSATQGFSVDKISGDSDDSTDDYYYYGYQFPNKNNTTYFLGKTYSIGEVTTNGQTYTSLTFLSVYANNLKTVNNLDGYYTSKTVYIVSDALVTANAININVDFGESGGKISGNVYGGGQNGAVKVEDGIYINHKSGEIKGYIYGGGKGDKTEFDVFENMRLTSLDANFIFTAEEEVDGYESINKQEFLDYLTADDGYVTIYEKALEYKAGTNWIKNLRNYDLKRKFDNFKKTIPYSSSKSYTFDTYYIYTDVINKLGLITGDTNISMNEGKVKGIYGGSEGVKGNITGSTSITITGGTVSTDVFGGGNLGGISKNPTDPNSGSTNIVISDSAYIKGNLYGGSNQSMVQGDTNITINNGRISKEVFGGGNLGIVEGNTNVTIRNTTNEFGNVYAGGNQAAVKGNTSLTVENGSFTSLFGGGNLGIVEGNSEVVAYNTKNYVDNIYAGGNQADVYGNTSLIINGGKFMNAFGGGNLGAVLGSSTVTINDAYVIYNLYAGGNQAEVIDRTDLTINGGKIETAFGGGNLGVVDGDIAVTINNNPIVFELYAASNQADVNGKVDLEVNGGTFGYIFGGNNITGDISGNITIDINNGVLCALYGGGNQADFNNTTIINFNNGTLVDETTIDSSVIDLSIVDNAIYGGGKIASVKNVYLNINQGIFQTSIYGGGYKGNVENTYLNIHGGTLGTDSIDGVFGGGFKGQVENVVFNVDNTKETPIFKGLLYGGGEDGRVTSKVALTIDNAVFENDIYGAGKGTLAVTTLVDIDLSNSTVAGNIFGGGNAGEILSNLDLNINNVSANNVYGGGNLAKVDGLVKVEVTDLLLSGNFFGGGNEADIKAAEVIINSGTFNGIFYGGGNNGHLDEDIKLTINNGVFKENIYGGGNQGNVNKKVTFTIVGGDFQHNVYGGGYAGTVNDIVMVITDNESYTPINVANDVFAGGEGVTATVMNTDLTIDLMCETIVKETLESNDAINSGEANVDFDPLTNINSISKINGSVYGGGDLGQISDGVIDLAKNTATITTPGSTNILIKNAHIGGSVFAGGRGVAPEGVSYNVYMGTVFGSTKVTVNSGYIGESVYGGGRQSRVYAYDDVASTVVLEQTNQITDGYNSHNLIIAEHVFGGGYRGNSESTNATVPTTIGNVSVTITGCDSGTAIYFINGGVYGDGDLCLVSGNKTVNMTNFTTGDNSQLKTFYSLQRADVVNLSNTDIVLLGAIDKVEEGDNTLYSINRVKQLNFDNGSTVKLTTIVKYLENVKSNYSSGAITPDRVFIDEGYNGSNRYNKEFGDPVTLTEEEIEDYRKEFEDSLKVDSDVNCLQNTISVANGLYLELSSANGGYGAVVGLFTLQLLVPKPGEGGGIVYADIINSTGDFICLTRFEPDALGNAEYMDVLDDVCRYESGKYTAYFWYIAGTRINYTVDIIGYIGTDQESFGQKLEIPKAAEEVDYVLSQITIPNNSQIVSALSSYVLVQKSSGLDGDEFAIEISFFGLTSGFLSYNPDSHIWGISPAEDGTSLNPYANDIVGYLNSDNEGDESNYRDNVLHSQTTFPIDSSISIILHKSSDIDLEFDDIDFNLEIHLFNDNVDDTYAKLKGTTNELFFECRLSIRRLVPLQYSYAASGHLYAGISIGSSDDVISITKNSSVTLEVLTRYIPGAFKKNETNYMEWILKSEIYNYYFDDVTGYFLVTDVNQKVINYSTRFNGCFNGDEVKPGNDMALTYNDLNDTYSYKFSDTETRTMSLLDDSVKASKTYFPLNTMITLVDRSNTESITIYYYRVTNSTTSEINLLDFMQMGSNKKISTILADENHKDPTFIAQYEASENENMRVAEDLVFIFNFTNVENFNWNSTGSLNSNVDNQFITNIHLSHMYQGDDIMDYTQKPEEDGGKYIKETPKKATIRISEKATGLDQENRIEFEEDEYYSRDDYEFEVEISEDIEWTNTEYQEREYSLILELTDLNGKPIVMPEGMAVIFKNTKYYSKDAGKTIIIPVKEDGVHKLTIENHMYGLYEHLATLNSSDYSYIDGSGNYAVRFEVVIYSAAYDQYYNELRIEIADLIDTVIIKSDLVDALSVTTDERIVRDNELILEVQSILASTSTINVYAKNANGGYELYQGRRDFLFSNLVLTGNKEKDYITVTISDNVQTGTYKIEVISGKCTDFITVVIVNNQNNASTTG